MIQVHIPERKVSWKVLEKCNYRCPYCLQKKYGYESDFSFDIANRVSIINQCLKEKCEIKIAGGELFYQPEKAVELAKEICKYGHWQSLCTNFSASLADYYRFIEATDGRIYKFSVSLHTDYADIDEFLNKCIQVRDYLPEYAKIQVQNVIPRGVENIKKLQDIKKKFEAEDLVFYTDLLVDDAGKYIQYTTEEQKAIDSFLGEQERLIRHYGKSCCAGQNYFVILPNLDAWICWEAWYASDRRFYLGNMEKGTFSFPNKRTTCMFETCSCPTPVYKEK